VAGTPPLPSFLLTPSSFSHETPPFGFNGAYDRGNHGPPRICRRGFRSFKNGTAAGDLFLRCLVIRLIRLVASAERSSGAGREANGARSRMSGFCFGGT